MMKSLTQILILTAFLAGTPLVLWATPKSYDETDALIRESNTVRKASLIRLGGGAFGTVHLADSKADKYYDDNWAAFADYFFSRNRSRYGNGHDYYARFTYKHFEMSDSKVEQKDDYIVYKGKINAMALDAGLRYIYGWYFWGRLWQGYVLAAPRVQHTNITSYDLDTKEKVDSKKYTSLGIVGGAGIEVTLGPNWALFAEYNYGYMPVSKSKTNTEGHQGYFGISYRNAILGGEEPGI